MFIPRFRTLLFLGCLVMLAFWWRYGEQMISSQRTDTASRVIAAYRADHLRQNPEAANWLQQLQDQHGQRVLAASLQANRGSLAPFTSQQHAIAASARLLTLFQADELRDESILWSHGTALTSLSTNDPSGGLSDQWLQRMEAAKADPATWTLVRDNPLMLTSDRILNDLPSREFYSDHQLWFDDLLAALMETVDPVADAGDAEAAATSQPTTGLPRAAGKPPAIDVDAVLELAMRHEPQLRQTIVDPTGSSVASAVVFLAFAEHGELLDQLASASVPTDEAIEVLLLNADALAGDSVADDAARMVRLYREKKRVWEQARREPLVLQFDQQVPHFSQGLLERFPLHGIPSLLVTQYPDQAVPAAAAIDRYGELAIAVLAHYEPSERFHTLLDDSQSGYRTVMVAAMQGDEGLEKLTADARYLDKLVDRDGVPRQADWWQAVPVVGGLGNVVRNYVQDRPSDWSEIGWAAWDVVDAALIVASVGTAKVVTEAGKQGMKSAARSAGRQAAMRGGSRTAGAAATRQTASLEGRTLLEGLGRGTSAGTLQVSHGAVAGRQAALTAGRTTLASQTLRIGSRSVAIVARPMVSVSGRAYQVGRALVAVAHSVPPAARVWIARGLLAASLMARTPQMAAQMVQSFGRFSGAMVDRLAKQIDAAKQMLGLPLLGEASLLAKPAQRLAYFAVLALLIALNARLLWNALGWDHRPRGRWRLG